MANLLSVPSAVLGLMGRIPRQQNPMLQIAADAGDEWFTNPQGRQQGAGVPVLEGGQIGFDNSQPAQRGRVNPLNVLFRGLAPNLSGALDFERARLQGEADAPRLAMESAENERIARALGPQALLALRTSPQALGEGLSAQYKPTTTGAGGVSTVFGTGQQVEAPRVLEFGNDLVQAGPLSGVQTLGTRGPSFSEQAQIARINQDAARDEARLGLDYDRLGQAESQFGRRLEFDERKEAGKGPTAESIAEASQQRLEMASNMENALTSARNFTGAAGVWSARNPLQAQNRANLSARLDTLKANLTFDNLARMKASSPSGASGLGSLSDNEGRLLASTVAALSVDMSPKELENSFAEIDRLIKKMKTQSSSAGRSMPALPSGFVLD